MAMDFRQYLNGRGITDEVIDRYGVTGDDKKIAIPVKGFCKYRTYPEKKYFYDKGFKAALFGVPQLTSYWCVLTEGELDALRLASIGIPAVSGTGGSKTWNPEWANELPQLVFICYDTDEAGKEGALKVHWQLPGSRIVDLPSGKDVTEYLESHTKEEFEELITYARIIPKPPPVLTYKKIQSKSANEVERAREHPIENLIKFTNKKAKCIWHTEKSPSLHLYPDNRVYCFGCGKSGDAIDVIMTLEKIDFNQAIQKLL